MHVWQALGNHSCMEDKAEMTFISSTFDGKMTLHLKH